LAAKPEAGFYTIELSATPVDQGKVRYISIDNTKKVCFLFKFFLFAIFLTSKLERQGFDRGRSL